MPEYSSTTITPADDVKTPAMNESTSGNYTLAALRAFVLASKGLANGLASLDGNGKLLSSQLPDLADDVLVYGSYALLPSPGTAGKLYITADNNKMYRWDDALTTPDYVVLSVDLSAYATKAEMEAADTDLKNALTAVDHRVQNLESAKGDYVPVDSTKGVISVPSGKGKWAVVEGLRGVSRVDNNAVKNSTFDGTTNWNWTPSNIDVSASDGILEMTMKGDEPSVGKTAWGISQAIGKMTAGHIYLICAEVNSPSGAGCDWNNQTINASVTANTWSPIYTVRTAIDHSTPTFYLFPAGLTNGQKMKVRNVHIRDLNVYFGTSDLSFLGATDSAKLATIQTNYTHLLTPSDYGTRIVDSSYSGVRGWSRNLFNYADFEVGDIASGTGANVTSSTAGRSKEYIPVKPNTLYYFKDATANPLKMRYYDINKNYIGFSDKTGGTNAMNQTRLMPDNCFYIRFAINGVTSIADNAICVNLSDSNDGTFTPYFTDTLSLPTPITLRSAGSVAEEFDLKTGKVSHPIGVQDLSQLGWTLSGSTPNAYYATMNGYAYKQDCGAVCDKLQYIGTVSTGTSGLANYDKVTAIYYHSTNPNVREVYLRDTSITSASQISGTLYFELATPNAPTQLEPIQNPTILTEAGGTISAQMEEPIDGNFSVGFITL